MLALLLIAAPALPQDWTPEPADDAWVSGVVRYPEGTPDGEVCRVVVEASEPEGLRELSFGEEWARMTGGEPWYVVDEATLDATRAFRLHLPRAARAVRLVIDGEQTATARAGRRRTSRAGRASMGSVRWRCV